MPKLSATPTGSVPTEHPRLNEFGERLRELYPQITREPYATIVHRIQLEDGEWQWLLDNPDGPRLAWHFVCRAAIGLEP